jgi:hypothetical protein
MTSVTGDVFGERSAIRERLARCGAPAVAFSVAGAVLLLELWAFRTRYGMRVIADTPTYMSLLRELALRPLHSPPSPYLSHSVNLAHATPDVQLLALIWKGLAHAGLVNANLVDAKAAYPLLAVKGAIVTFLVFHALFLWARHQSGSARTAWLTVAALPFVWGPALIVCPGDFSFHGFMTTADHSEPLAIALLLYALIVLDAKLKPGRLLGAGMIVGAVTVTHPFTGVRLMALASALACYHAGRREPEGTWRLTPPALALGYLIAAAWPAYHLSEAMQVGPLDGVQIMLLLAALPYLAFVVSAVVRRVARPRPLRLPVLDTPKVALRLAFVGVAVVIVVAARELWLFRHPDPWLRTNRLAIYWNGPNIKYWPLLLAPALVGFVGLIRLVREEMPLPALWAGGCLGIGVLGSLGFNIPLWHRFLLFAQIPLALGIAVVIAKAEWRAAGSIAVCTMACSAGLAFGALLLMPKNVTYFRNKLQAGWSLGELLPNASPTLIASDPASSYFFIPLGDRTLTLTTWHVGGPSELPPIRRGYLLIHRLYVGDRWRAAARQMWKLGVRYVVVNRGFRIQAPTVDAFSSFSTPYLVRNWAQLAEVEGYVRRLSLIAQPVGRRVEYYVYRLDRRRLFR